MFTVNGKNSLDTDFLEAANFGYLYILLQELKNRSMDGDTEAGDDHELQKKEYWCWEEALRLDTDWPDRSRDGIKALEEAVGDVGRFPTGFIKDCVANREHNIGRF